MVDTYRGQEYFYQYSPEYWDEHRLDDDCPATDIPECAKNATGLAFEALDDYLIERRALERPIDPLASFKEPNHFRAERYPIDTILHIKMELLTEGNSKISDKAYGHHNRHLWGVIVDAINKKDDNERVIIGFENLHLDPNAPFPFLETGTAHLFPGYFKIGEVQHARKGEEGFLINSLRRVNEVELISYGYENRGTPKRRFSFPKLGNLFPTPLPKGRTT